MAKGAFDDYRKGRFSHLARISGRTGIPAAEYDESKGKEE